MKIERRKSQCCMICKHICHENPQQGREVVFSCNLDDAPVDLDQVCDSFVEDIVSSQSVHLGPASQAMCFDDPDEVK